MAEAIARAMFLPYTQRKMGIVLDQVRGKNVQQAQTILQFLSRRAAKPVLKALNSALTNLSAKAGRKVSPLEAVVASCIVNQGPALKRIHTGSMGRAFPYRHKMCHLMIKVAEQKNGSKN